MKRILLILTALVFIGPTASYAQTTECGTPDISETDYMALPWYGDEDDTFLTNFYDSLENAMGGNPAARGVVQDVWYRIPIQFWIYRISSTNPGGANPLPDEENIQILMDAANEACRNNGIKVQFYLDCYEFINNADGITVNDFSQEKNLAFANRKTGAINVHIVDELLDEDDKPLGGKFNLRYNAIFINRQVSFNDVSATTFPHELGHYFGLMHTFQWSGDFCFREPVTRGYKVTACPNMPGYNKRCKWTGDLLCDTPADPQMSAAGITNCVYTSGETDHYGDTYAPDVLNYMAYGNHGCRNNFSQRQIQWMYWWLVHVQRSRSSGSNWSTITDNTAFDVYEPDNSDIAAREIAIGEVQEHSFYGAANGICKDNKDWLRFRYPTTGTNYDLQLEVSDGGPVVDEVKVYLRNFSTGTQGAQLTNLTETIISGVRKITLPCASLTPGDEYLIEISRNQSNIGNYEVALIELGTPPTVSGPDFVCSTNTTFTLNNPPVGATITWAATPPSRFATTAGASQSGNGATAVVRAATSGEGTITFYIQGSCGTVPIKKENVWVGSPSISSFNYINTSFPEWPATGDVCTNSVGHYTASIHPNYPSSHYADIFWSASGAQLSMSSGSAVTVIYNGPVGTYATISATAVGQCGQEAGHHTVLLLLGDCGGGGIIMAYPNPVKEELIVSLPEVGSEVTLYNSSQSVVYSQVAGGNEVIVPVKELPNGTYYLHIRSSKGLLQRQIMVSH